VINSPGGSPSQSGLIARQIRRLADEKEIPVVAFCEDHSGPTRLSHQYLRHA